MSFSKVSELLFLPDKQALTETITPVEALFYGKVTLNKITIVPGSTKKCRTESGICILACF